MIEFAIIMLVVVGVFSALAGFVGRDMREDVRKRDEVADLFMGPRASNPPGGVGPPVSGS